MFNLYLKNKKSSINNHILNICSKIRIDTFFFKYPGNLWSIDVNNNPVLQFYGFIMCICTRWQ